MKIIVKKRMKRMKSWYLSDMIQPSYKLFKRVYLRRKQLEGVFEQMGLFSYPRSSELVLYLNQPVGSVGIEGHAAP